MARLEVVLIFRAARFTKDWFFDTFPFVLALRNTSPNKSKLESEVGELPPILNSLLLVVNEVTVLHHYI